jgi:hypothetical protein
VRSFAIVALISVAAFSSCQRSSESRTSPGNEDDVLNGGTPRPVQDYLRIADTAGAEATPIDDEFLANALRNLAAALGTLDLADLELQVDLRVAAEHVLSNPEAVETTAAVRQSLIAAAEAIEADGRGDGRLRQSAESLRPDRPLPEQVATVRDFFRTSIPPLRRGLN